MSSNGAGSSHQAPEQASNFAAAFGNLKNSEFYTSAQPAATSSTDSLKSSTDSLKSSTAKPIVKPVSSNTVIVSHRQRGNPLLKSVTQVPYEYADIVPDYVLGATTCALFLSLRYHNLNPNYIQERLKMLGKQYTLRVLLVLVDVKDPHHELKGLTKICVLCDLTLMLAWSNEEAGKIIETYKVFEHKPPDLIMEKQDTNPFSMLVDALTTIRSVNKTDAMTLLSNFGTLEKILDATEDQLALCPGMGPNKASKLYKVLHQSFKK